MKILQVAFLLLFNYLDSLPKLYHGFSLPNQSVIISDREMHCWHDSILLWVKKQTHKGIEMIAMRPQV